ncbi:hypothetical protein F2P81_014037 [Scophthalmus maximus]|uniref:Uncharacterized protein n=1 Tax=Scophthalmus maximus TaxID=52904 RepID=A0A6A4SSI0_SCOMX|nr:hypothetical protein F2P81_014037 [Scophthalmus maximus]
MNENENDSGLLSGSWLEGLTVGECNVRLTESAFVPAGKGLGDKDEKRRRIIKFKVKMKCSHAAETQKPLTFVVTYGKSTRRHYSHSILAQY